VTLSSKEMSTKTGEDAKEDKSLKIEGWFSWRSESSKK
jgi:hypothetical protein